MRDLIISKIKRLAAANGDSAPGVTLFAKQTGIAEHKWRGIYWARWGDALIDAGFPANTLNARLDSSAILRRVLETVRQSGSLPTFPEMGMLRRKDPSFPDVKTLRRHFGNRSSLISALRRACVESGENLEVLDLIPEQPVSSTIDQNESGTSVAEGWVYLIRAGDFYKVGRSDELERRVKQIAVALPHAATLVHAIKTDDPVGIEHYWHRRFAAHRANGEWFKLPPGDVAAFSKRKFQ